MENECTLIESEQCLLFQGKIDLVNACYVIFNETLDFCQEIQ